MAQGQRQESLRQFHEAIRLAQTNFGMFLSDFANLAPALSGLEEAYDDPEEFRAFCRRFREEHPDVGAIRESPLRFVQWYLEPTTNFGFRNADFGLEEDNFENLEAQIRNPQSTIRNSKWTWHDQFGFEYLEKVGEFL